MSEDQSKSEAATVQNGKSDPDQLPTTVDEEEQNKDGKKKKKKKKKEEPPPTVSVASMVGYHNYHSNSDANLLMAKPIASNLRSWQESIFGYYEPWGLLMQ